MILFSIMAYAQPPVMDSTWLPSAGDTYYTYDLVDYFHNYWHPYNPDTKNDTGANVNWDFSTANYIMPNKVLGKLDFNYPWIRHINCAFPQANLATGDSNHFRCFIKNNDGVAMLDLRNSFDGPYGLSNEFYSKPWPLMKRNFHFHQEYYDTSNYYFYPYGNPADTPYRGMAPFYQKYDGYGKLKILGYEFDTVIRVHILHTEHDTINKINNHNLGNSNETLLIDEYDWFTPSIHYPVLRMYTQWLMTVADPNPSSPADYAFITLKSSPAGLPGPPTSPIQVISAVFDGDAIIIYGLAKEKISYQLYSSTGQLLQQGQDKSVSGYSDKIYAPNIGPGVYIIRIKGMAGETQTIKAVKE